MKSWSNVKAVIVDLDRTLLNTDKKLSAYTEKILHTCKKRGIRIIIATARPYRSAEQYFDAISADAIVVSNGARIICGKRQMDNSICRENAVQLLRNLREYSSLLVTLETGEVAYSNRVVEDYETIITEDLAAIAQTKPALKILVRLDSENTLRIVEKHLPDDLYYSISNAHLIQIMNKAATKWNGIKTLLAFYQCTAAETAYFGDDHDDLEPIRMCGLGIAVSNAIDEAKAVADYITDSNDNDGVARAVEKFILNP